MVQFMEAAKRAIATPSCFAWANLAPVSLCATCKLSNGQWGKGGQIHILKDPEPIRIRQEEIQMRSDLDPKLLKF